MKTNEYDSERDKERKTERIEKKTLTERED